jgi:hypothetical protein
MSKKKLRSVMAALVLAVLTSAGCGEDVGLCVSTPVEYTYGLRVYCYGDNWTQAECSDYNAQRVNGAEWFFHSNQTCADRGLVDGSNPWP